MTPTPAPAADEDGLRGRLSLDHSPNAPTLHEQLSVDQQAPTARAPEMLRNVTIRGSSLDPAILGATWRDKVGQPLDDAHIRAIGDALNAAYRASDIALFNITAPRQTLDDGTLDLVIIEGHISEVSITSDEPDAADLRLIRAYGERLTHEQPLRKPTLERYMSLIRDIPGETVTPSLQPTSTLGQVRLALNATRKSFDFGVALNNRGTPRLGRTQVNADASLNGILRSGDRTTLSYAMPTEGDYFTYVGLVHSTPIGHDGLRLQMNVSRLDTRPRDSAVVGRAIASGVSASYPIMRGFRRNLSVTGGFDALNSDNAVLGQVFDTSRTRVIRAGLSYSDAESTRAISTSASLSFGIDGLGAHINPIIASPDFTKLNIQAATANVFFNRLSLRLRGAAQLTSDQLPTSEGFSLGGDAFGRAFTSAIVQGDQGYGISLETAYRPMTMHPDWMQGSEAYVFIDGGEAFWRERPLIPSANYSLASGGIGARVMLGSKTSMSLEAARALDAPFPDLENEWRVVYAVQTRY